MNGTDKLCMDIALEGLQKSGKDARITALEARLAHVHRIANSAIKTQSKDIGDWIDDMTQIRALAAEPTAPQPTDAKQGGK